MYCYNLLFFFLVYSFLIIEQKGDALPLGKDECGNGMEPMQKSKMCPSPFLNNSVTDNSTTCVLEEGQRKCHLIAVNFTNTRNIIGNWKENCSVVYLIPDGLSFPKCVPINSAFVQLVFRTRLNDSKCQLTTQEYNYKENCENVTFVTCIQQEPSPCPQNIKTPRPRAAFSKNEMKKSERPEIIRRVKKPSNWSWKDYMLEMIIVIIVAVALLLIWLKVCLQKRFQGSLDTLRRRSRGVVRFDIEEKRRKFSHCLNSTSPPSSQGPKPPSKPILKNNPKKERKLSNIMGQNEIKSFDSSGSIYYDALDDPKEEEEEEGSPCPLIRPQQ